jgi:hypothetical protein
MYATIRRYSAKTPVPQQTVEEFKRRIEEKYVPLILDIRGFHGYGVLSTGNKELVSFSIFEDKEGATESTRRAAEFVRNDPLVEQLGKPEVIEGDLLILKEAGVGVR